MQRNTRRGPNFCVVPRAELGVGRVRLCRCFPVKGVRWVGGCGVEKGGRYRCVHMAISASLLEELQQQQSCLYVRTFHRSRNLPLKLHPEEVNYTLEQDKPTCCVRIVCV